LQVDEVFSFSDEAGATRFEVIDEQAAE